MNTLVSTKLLIACNGEKPIEKGWLIFDENGRIVEVSKPGEGLPSCDQHLDFSEQYIMPGLIDGHTHFGLSHSDRIDPMPVITQLMEPGPRKICKAIMYLQEHINAGVTTVRDMGEDDFIDFDLKHGVDQGYLVGPRIIPVGAFISPTHGHGQTGQTVSDGVEEVRKNVRVNLAKGAELIKVFGSGGVATGKTGVNYCTATFAELRTAVEEAKALGKYVATHVHGGPGVDLCIEAGVRSFEHATLLTNKQIERIADNDLWVTITFSPVFHPDGLHGLDAEKQARLDFVKPQYIDVVKKMLEKDINLCMGTDGVHGAMWFEATKLEECGVSRIKVLETITRNAALSCRMEQDIGVIEKGRLADFIVLDNNPLDDLQNLKSVRRVFIGGHQKVHQA